MDTENDFENNNICGLILVIFKSNSVSINKKNHFNIKFSLLNKTLHSVKPEIFSIKL